MVEVSPLLNDINAAKFDLVELKNFKGQVTVTTFTIYQRKIATTVARLRELHKKLNDDVATRRAALEKE